jgi:threonine dehydrogenase-like Zn-dependent dehydrogenase
LCSAIAAGAAGAEVALVTRHAAQLEAGEKLGIELVGSECGGGYDVVIDCAGTPSATAMACEALRPKGTLLMLAPSWDTIELPGFMSVAKELEFVVSKMYGRIGTAREIELAANQLAAREEIADALISHRFPLCDAPRAFETARDRKSGAIKVVLEP